MHGTSGIAQQNAGLQGHPARCQSDRSTEARRCAPHGYSFTHKGAGAALSVAGTPLSSDHRAATHAYRPPQTWSGRQSALRMSPCSPTPRSGSQRTGQRCTLIPCKRRLAANSAANRRRRSRPPQPRQQPPATAQHPLHTVNQYVLAGASNGTYCMCAAPPASRPD